MTSDSLGLRALALDALRIGVGFAYFAHGTQKLLGWFGGMGPEGGTAVLMSRFGAAGIIETVAGGLLVFGLFTRPAAFLASGEMAVAYFWMHWIRTGELWWWDNRGEVVMLFSFVWLLFAVWGPGPFSLDAWLRHRREAPSAVPMPARAASEIGGESALGSG